MAMDYETAAQRAFARYVTAQEESPDSVTVSVGLWGDNRISGLTKEQAEEAKSVLLFAMNQAAKTTRPERLLIIDDRRSRSAWRPIMVYAGLVGVVGIGWAMGSAALQWIGGVLFVLAVAALVPRMNIAMKKRSNKLATTWMNWNGALELRLAGTR